MDENTNETTELSNGAMVLPATDEAFDRFVAERTPEKYEELVRVFVAELMSNERPTIIAPINVDALSPDKPISTGVIRDAMGRPSLVFLTSTERNHGSFEAIAEVAAMPLVDEIMNGNGLLGIALNPWDGGGVVIPAAFFMQIFQTLIEGMGEGNVAS